MGTWWNGGKDLGWLAVQFADPSTVSVIHLHFASNAPPAFDLYLDLDGDGSYTPEEEIRSVSGNVDLDWRWSFVEVPAQGMKVAFTGYILVCDDEDDKDEDDIEECDIEPPRVREFEAYLYADDDGSGLPGDAEVFRGNLGSEAWYYYADGMVNTANGNLFLAFRDISLQARGFTLAFTRSYNSGLHNYSGPLGWGWTHNYNTRLAEDAGGNVTWMDEDGSLHTFSPQGGGLYAHPPGIHSKLVKASDNAFTLWHDDGSRYLFNTTGRLLQIVDKNGNSLTLSYQHGRLAHVEDDSGLFLNFSHDADGRILTVEDPTGRKISFSYSGSNLVRYTDPLGNADQFAYDADNRLTSSLDPVGKRVAVSYASGRVAEVWHYRHNVSGGQDEWGFRALALDYVDTTTVTVTNARGFVTTVTLGANFNPTDVVGPQDQILGPSCGVSRQNERIRYSWDADFNAVQIVDGRGNAWNFTYDDHGHLLSRTDPLGNVTAWGWTHVDKGTSYISLLMNQTDARSFTTVSEYDDRGNVVNITDATGNTTANTYDDDGFVIQRTDRRGFTTGFEYDQHGRLVSQMDPENHTASYEYDAVGRRTNLTSALGHATMTTYDAEDRVLSITDDLGNTTRRFYNVRGDMIETIDQKNVSSQYLINVTLGTVDKVLSAVGCNCSTVVTNRYDLEANLISVTDPNNHTTEYVFDAFNRLVSETSPSGNSTLHKYDFAGNRVQRTDANGNATAYSYDELNRLVSTDYLNGTVLKTTYDEVGNPTEITGYGYVRTQVFDPLNRVTNVSFDFGPFTKTVLHEYDAEANRIGIVRPEGHRIDFAYDGDGLPVNLIEDGRIWTYVYDADHRKVQLRHPNGVVSNWTYDDADRLTTLETKWANGTTLESFSYTYDNAANRLSMEEADGSKTTYTYDDLYRLVQVNYSGGSVVAYVYDGAGNRLEKNEGGVITTYTYDEDDRLLSSSDGWNYQNDNNGNLMERSDGSVSYSHSYDHENRLIAVNASIPTQISYTYSARGYRISRSVDGTATLFLYDFLGSSGLGNVLGEYSANPGELIAALVHGPGVDEPLGLEDDTGTYLYHSDALGSITALTNLTAAQAARYRYEVFGDFREKSGLNNTYGFTARENGDAEGMYYYRARSYLPEIGRFVQRDPAGMVDGPNLYTYVGNNPVVRTDPTGEWFHCWSLHLHVGWSDPAFCGCIGIPNMCVSPIIINCVILGCGALCLSGVLCVPCLLACGGVLLAQYLGCTIIALWAGGSYWHWGYHC
ncbi:MAG: RHS repeat-associated core domain-containing protein [Thermoplasmata archaeon]|jgi:RHS repeat-associated protein